MSNHFVKKYPSPLNLADSEMTKDFDFSKVRSWVFFRESAKFNGPVSFLEDLAPFLTLGWSFFTSQLNLTDSFNF